MASRNIILLSTLTACAPSWTSLPPAQTRMEAYPDFQMVNQLLVSFQGRSLAAQSILTKKGPHLDLLLLTPTGQKILRITHKGKSTTTDILLEMKLPLTAQPIIQDIQRIYFTSCPGPPGRRRACQAQGRQVEEYLAEDEETVVRRVIRGQGEVLEITYDDHRLVQGRPMAFRIRLSSSKGYALQIVMGHYSPLRPIPH